MPYSGPERRLHRVYVTRNTEYHMRGDRCVAVRDRRSGSWQPAHAALNRRAVGAVRFRPDGALNLDLGAAEVGAHLCFDGNAVLTSPVEDIRRPAFRDVRLYPVQWSA